VTPVVPVYHPRREARRAVKQGYPRRLGTVRLCRSGEGIERLLQRHLVDAVVLDVKAAPELAQALPRFFPRFDMFQRLEWMTYDWRMRRAVSSASQVATNLGAVFIDDDSLKAINDNFQFSWPWPRQLYGRLIGELSAQGAKAVGFDILFRELHTPSPDTAVTLGETTFNSDDFFAWQSRKASNVVLAVMDEKMGNQWRVLLPADKFRTNAWMLGHITSDVDSDGVLRRAKAYYDDPAHGRFWHMGIVLAARALNVDLSKAVTLPGKTYIHAEVPPAFTWKYGDNAAESATVPAGAAGLDVVFRE